MMKLKFVFSFIIVLLLVSCFSAQGQYRLNKWEYSYKQYDKDVHTAYNPWIAGGLSALLPGLGHVYASEPLRGLVFTTGYLGGSVLYVGGILATWTGTGMMGFHEDMTPLFLWGGLLLVGASYYGSIFDAVRVAKVNSIAVAVSNNIPLSFGIGRFPDTNAPLLCFRWTF